MNTSSKPSKEQEENWHNDSNNWKWGMFYVNKLDPRTSVPKRNKNMGITLNFAKPISFVLVVIMLTFIILITTLIVMADKG